MYYVIKNDGQYWTGSGWSFNQIDALRIPKSVRDANPNLDDLFIDARYVKLTPRS